MAGLDGIRKNTSASDKNNYEIDRAFRLCKMFVLTFSPMVIVLYETIDRNVSIDGIYSFHNGYH